VNDGAFAPKHKSKKQKATKKRSAAMNTQKCIVSAIEKAGAHESKMTALRLLLEFGTAVEKENAGKEFACIAFGRLGISGMSSSNPSTILSSE
jgi:hypothetical protein